MTTGEPPPDERMTWAPRRWLPLRAAVAIAALVAVLAPPAALGFEAARQEAPAPRSIGRAAVPAPSVTTSAPGAAASPGGSRLPPAAGTDRPISDGVRAALDRQAGALLAGDLDGFLAPVPPQQERLRAELRRRFEALRALRVAVWSQTVTGVTTREADGTWRVPVRLHYCFVVPDCSPLRLTVQTRWTAGADAPSLVAFDTSGSEELGPRPWEVSELRVAFGERVMIATTPRYANRLSSMLAAAEKAAITADRFAKWGKPPARYVVFLAGPDEWGAWYGLKQQSWVAAYAMPLTADVTEVVLNAGRVQVRETVDVLRHEFAHVTTLASVERTYERTWWLVEGVAEYIRLVDDGDAYDGMFDVRRFVHSGRWDGNVALDSPPEDATTSDVNGRYGLAYLAVRRLVDRFGEAKMLEFFAATAREGVSLKDASNDVFGEDWDAVGADCAQFVRSRT